MGRLTKDEKEYYDRLTFAEKVEYRIDHGVAYPWDKWLYKHVAPYSNVPESSADAYAARIKKAATTDLDEYNKRITIIAERLGITPEEATIRYFSMLDAYTKLKKNGVERSTLTPMKNDLNELFKGMRIETLLIAGKPYFFKMGWWGYGSPSVRSYEDVDDPKNFCKWNEWCTQFLFNAGFEHA